MRAVILGLAACLWSATPSNSESLTLTPEWQMLRDSLTGIGLSLEGASQPLTDVSLYFREERLRLDDKKTALDEERRLLKLDKLNFETERVILEERGRLYNFLRKETDDLKVELDKAYSRGIKWALLCGGIGVGIGMLLGLVI